MQPTTQRVQVVDSHTGGEPTRIVISGGPDLGSGDMASRRKIFQEQFDDFRSAVVNEPRGSDVWVGGILCEPIRPESAAGVVFFNNVGVLNMCGHGTIGLTVTLAHLGRIEAGHHVIETPVGDVSVALHEDQRVTVTNVPSYRFRSNIELDLGEDGTVCGDVAWGGNWFFLVRDHNEDVCFENIDRLTRFALKIRHTLDQRGITGEAGQQIDHVELFGPAGVGADSRNFVLCPGGAYDRSPCGTGTSAKLACLMADGSVKAGQTWRQESIVGSIFEVQGQWQSDRVIPTITGSAYVNAESTLILDPSDPFCMGIG